MSRVAKYARILGVTPDASLAQIKAAYRKRAKKLHPDVNPAPDAHERFVQLNEAFEYLEKLREGKIFTRSAYTTQSKEANWQARRRQAEQAQRAREQARARAREYARMRYREFINSDYYRHTMAWQVIWDNVGLFVGLTLFVILPVIAVLTGAWMFSVTALVGLVLTPFGYTFFKERETIGIRRLLQSLKLVAGTFRFLVPLQLLMAVFLFFRIVMNTLIPWFWLLVGMALSVGGMLLLNRQLKGRVPRGTRYVYAFGLVPLGINLLFLLNFLFSSDPRVLEIRMAPNPDNLAYISLKEASYNRYPAMRWYTDYRETVGQNVVLFRVENGLLGIKVIREYEFRYKK